MRLNPVKILRRRRPAQAGAAAQGGPFTLLGPVTRLTRGGGGSVADGTVGGGHYDPESVPADPPTTPPASPSPGPSPSPSPSPGN